MFFIVKLSIASGLIYWLMASGKIDFSVLLESSNNMWSWILAFVILGINTILISIRWKNILTIQASKKFKLISVIKFTFIGNLFNTVLPGMVSGDFIKLLYAKKIDSQLSKTFLLASVFIDRILGLFGLLLMLGITSFIYHQELISLSSEMKYILNINYLLFLGMVGFLLTLFLPKNIQALIIQFLKKIPFIGKIFIKICNQFWLIGKDKLKIFKLIFLSLFCQAVNICIFWILASPYIQYQTLNTPQLSLIKLYTFVPLGLVATAIPITPVGIGVGHTAFDFLFKCYGVINGANLFNFHLVLNILMNLMGVFPYLFSRKSESNIFDRKLKDMSLDN